MAAEVEQRAEQTRERLDEMATDVAADVERQVARTRGELEARLDSIPDDLGQRFDPRLAALESSISEEREARQSFDGRIEQQARTFRELEQKFDEQILTSQRLSGLLSNLDKVFSAQRAAPSPDAAVDEPRSNNPLVSASDPPDAPESADRDAPQMSSNELDNALNNLFQGS
jgi:hypothetical protein